MSAENRSLKDLQKKIIQFRDDRNWQQFHKLKDLLMGLNIEAGELNELFLWKDEKEIESVDKVKTADELADIFIFLAYISEHFNIDLSEAIETKIDKNAKKYPVDKAFGSNKKYTEL
jgi:NTP pyrophosphatase (non-canonical NTP hydrolase)